ncbi:MAG: potassium channel family protein [Acidobacteriota bacterium]
MSYLKYIGLIFAVIAALMLMLKLLEMIKCMWWVYRVGDRFIKEVDANTSGGLPPNLNDALHRHSFPFFPGNVWLTRWMQAIHRRGWGRRLIGLVFRYPNLMVLCSASVVLFSQGDPWKFDGSLMILMTFLIFIGIVVKAVHLLIYRYRFGVMDNLLLSLSVPTMEESVAGEVSRRKSLQNFIRIVLSSLATFLVGFSAIYYGIAKGMIAENYLQGIRTDAPICVQTTYFSAATLLTVGFGDIWPVGPVAQLAVMSEMLVSLLLLVIFVTAFSATVPSSGD